MAASPFLNNVRHRAIITPVSPLRTRLIGAGTQISGSNSSSGHLNFLAPAPEQFGPKNRINHCIICTTRLPHKLFVKNRSQISGSGSTT